MRAARLIQRRKAKWAETSSMAQDRQLREAIAEEILAREDLLAEIRENPELLIELVFLVVDKNQKTVPFFLNGVQREFIATLNRAREDYKNGRVSQISLLVLKGRQQGFTSLVTAYQLACSILNRNFQGFTLADKSDNAEAIFQNKAKVPYGLLPECLKPTEKYNNRRQLLFEKLNSSWAVDTATRDVGRSRTVNFFHGSECAFWKDGISSVQGALGEAFTGNCIKIYESTANGYNDYKKMWDSGVHINCFYPWWKTKEYRISLRGGAEGKAFLGGLSAGRGWIWDRLRWLQAEKNLEPEQLFWYWNKYNTYLDKDFIKQEYPCTPQEAFLLSGKSVFDIPCLLARLDAISGPLKTGFFAYDYDGVRISNIRWVNEKNGYINVYWPPGPGEYCIGGDTAGEGSDYFTGHVLDARTGQQVAVLRHQFDADQYARQMYCLGRYYKNALIGVEANFDSYPIRELQRLGYPRQYTREALDTYTGKTEKRFGFKTTSLTRPTILSRLTEIVREHCDTINDKATLEELLTIVRNEKGRIEAPAGGHDDLMMGLAIAHEVRGQAVFLPEAIPMGPPDPFGRSSPWDWGEEITVV